MTASIPSLLQPLKDRLAAATPGPWKAEPYLSGVVEDGRVRVTSPSNSGIYNTAEDVLPNDAALIASAPTDQAKLIAAIEAVESLAAAWQARGEHLRKFAETVPEDVREALDEQGADTLWHANLVRAALTQALGGDTA
jgi:hypothetical protein